MFWEPRNALYLHCPEGGHVPVDRLARESEKLNFLFYFILIILNLNNHM